MNIAFQCKLRVNKLTLSPKRPSPLYRGFVAPHDLISRNPEQKVCAMLNNTL